MGVLGGLNTESREVYVEIVISAAISPVRPRSSAASLISSLELKALCRF